MKQRGHSSVPIAWHFQTRDGWSKVRVASKGWIWKFQSPWGKWNPTSSGSSLRPSWVLTELCKRLFCEELVLGVIPNLSNQYLSWLRPRPPRGGKAEHLLTGIRASSSLQQIHWNKAAIYEKIILFVHSILRWCPFCGHIIWGNHRNLIISYLFWKYRYYFTFYVLSTNPHHSK